MKFKRVQILVGVLFLVVNIFFSQVVVAEKIGVAVDSSMVVTQVESEKNAQFSFRIKNQTDFAQSIHLEVRDISIGDDNKVVFLEAKDGPSSLVIFERNDFILAGGQTQQVRASLQIPDGQKIGAQMMTFVSFEPQNKESSTVDGPKVNGSIGIFTIISAKGAKNAAGMLGNLSYLKLDNGSAVVNVQYSNVGDVQFVPKGRLSILNLLTKEKSETSFEDHFIFPEKSFTFKKNIFKLSPFWVYEVKVSFVDGNGSFSEKSKYVMGKFFPIVFFLIFAILGFLSFFLMKMRKKNSLEIAKGESLVGDGKIEKK